MRFCEIQESEIAMRFLVVDDSPTSRRLIIASLKALGHLDAIEACDGVEALDKLKQTRVDIIVTDWNMPNLNGRELVSAIRANKKLKNIPVIMCTTRSEKDDILDAAKSKINGYIIKPFSPDVFREKLEPIIKLIDKDKPEESVSFPVNISVSKDRINNFDSLKFNLEIVEKNKSAGALTFDVSAKDLQTKGFQILTRIAFGEKISLTAKLLDARGKTLDMKSEEL